MTDLLTGHDIEYLRAAIATRCNMASVVAETNAANHALVRKVVHKLDIKAALHTWIWVVHSMPIVTLPLEMWRKLLGIVLGQRIADLLDFAKRVL